MPEELDKFYFNFEMINVFIPQNPDTQLMENRMEMAFSLNNQISLSIVAVVQRPTRKPIVYAVYTRPSSVLIKDTSLEF